MPRYFGINWKKLFHPRRYGCPKSPDGLHNYHDMERTDYIPLGDGTAFTWLRDATECVDCGKVYRKRRLIIARVPVSADNPAANP